MKKVLNWLDKYFEETILLIFLALLSCVMMVQVLMRYIFQAPLTWSEEFCRYCFVYSVMLATAYCIRTNRMLKVDVVISLFPKRVEQIMDIVSKILATVFCLLMVVPSYNVMMSTKIGAHWQTSPAMQIPMAVLYSCAPIGFALGSVRGVQSVILAIRDMVKGKTSEEAANK